jgi:hypothetical protein
MTDSVLEFSLRHGIKIVLLEMMSSALKTFRSPHLVRGIPETSKVEVPDDLVERLGVSWVKEIVLVLKPA